MRMENGKGYTIRNLYSSANIRVFRVIKSRRLSWERIGMLSKFQRLKLQERDTQEGLGRGRKNVLEYMLNKCVKMRNWINSDQGRNYCVNATLNLEFHKLCKFKIGRIPPSLRDYDITWVRGTSTNFKNIFNFSLVLRKIP